MSILDGFNCRLLNYNYLNNFTDQGSHWEADISLAKQDIQRSSWKPGGRGS
jgi:hypothetical protein